ncbi:MAG: acetyl ornithine aminotransferase family protein [Candidatus Eiseniibacteriota bacterium]|nr:MAG: acetyl ornithine aminotransferase family protein [Candidatus Eisenbacteria bacterium]
MKSGRNGLADKKGIRKTRTLPGSEASKLIQKDRLYMTKSHVRIYPLVVDRGKGTWLWDVDGNRFLDFTAGIAVCSTGHSHPAVVRAIRDQASRFLHMCGMDFYYPVQVELTEKLTQITPGRFSKRVLLCNSGAEAVEAAIKLCRYQTRRTQAIAFYGAFHGRTMGSLSLTASKALQRRYFSPLLPGVTHVPYADCLRCRYNLSYPQCDFACVNFIEEVVFKKTAPPEDVAAIFVEPIQGEGGYIVPPDGFHSRLKKLAEKYGILFVADEIQSGMGRTGKMFAIQHWNIAPDVVTIAKGVASGLPLGATVARSVLMEWEGGAHGSTFGGNPLSCAAALETISLLEKGLIQNAEKMGNFLMESLKEIETRHSSIGWIRGKGLMIGIEVLKTPGSKDADPEKRDWLVNRCFEKGLLVLPCGESALRFSPPLVVTKKEAEFALEVFDEALTDLEQRKQPGSDRPGK